MHPDERARASVVFVVGFTVATWLIATWLTSDRDLGRLTGILHLAALTATGGRPVLLVVAVAGMGIALAVVILANRVAETAFGGAFRTHLRGTKVVSATRLGWSTRERRQVQISVAGVPMPTAIETLHLLVGGSTGSGKVRPHPRDGVLCATPRGSCRRRRSERGHARQVSTDLGTSC